MAGKVCFKIFTKFAELSAMLFYVIGRKAYLAAFIQQTAELFKAPGIGFLFNGHGQHLPESLPHADAKSPRPWPAVFDDKSQGLDARP